VTAGLDSTDADGIRVLTLDRPEVRNALDGATLQALASAVADADADPATRVILLTGSPPAFCAGLDVKSDVLRDRELWPRTLSTLLDCTTPIVAAVNGAASTAGLGLVLACDFAVAAQGATFTDRHAHLGMLPRSGMATILVHRIGLARAKEMMVTGRPISAATALAWGLVNHVVAADQLMTVATELADSIARHDPALITEILSIHDEGSQLTMRDHRDLERKRSDAWVPASSGHR